MGRDTGQSEPDVDIFGSEGSTIANPEAGVFTRPIDATGIAAPGTNTTLWVQADGDPVEDAGGLQATNYETVLVNGPAFDDPFDE